MPLSERAKTVILAAVISGTVSAFVYFGIQATANYYAAQISSQVTRRQIRFV